MVKNTGAMHKGHRQRLKNRALKNGLESMEPHEIVEWALTYTIPYKDVNPLAHELINHFGSISGIFDAGYETLSKINGLGHESALFLSLLPELFKVYSASKSIGKVIIPNLSTCVNHFRSIKSIGQYEEFYVFCLDYKQQLLQLVKIADGNSSSVSFETPTLTNKIMCKGISSVVLLHTHPHGETHPSKADFIATKKILSVCYTLGVKVEDHIIINETNYYSFAKSGAFLQLVEDVANSLTELLNPETINYLKASIGFVNNIPRPKDLLSPKT